MSYFANFTTCRKVARGCNSGRLALATRVLLLCIASTGGQTATRLSAAESNLALMRAVSSIQVDQIQSHAETLAGDFFEGREAGQAGGHAAATYIMKALQKQKERLHPAGDHGTYFQAFGGGYRNILAVFSGTEPRLRDEYLVVTAHYDHVGYGTRKTSNGPVGYIHNGADDNASGVTVLLELAEALQTYGSGLKRSVLFIWWDAEEKGLWGSKYWLDQPTIPLDRINLMLNVDMVGRLRDSMWLYGTRSMPGLRAAWSRANLDPDLRLAFPWTVLDNSDHFPFFERSIPITMLHTGLHDDYHRPSDDASRLNIDGIRNITELLLRFTVAFADQDEIKGFRAESKLEATAEQHAFDQPAPPRLGVSWREDSVVRGLQVVRVWSDSPAERAGIRPGDCITQLGEEPLRNAEQLRRAVASTFGELRITLRRDDSEVVCPVFLAGDRPRVGITWRTDPAEPDNVIVSEVTPGFPGEQAGLRRLDRIHSILGHRLASADEFRERLSAARGAVELLIERDGQLKQCVMHLPPQVIAAATTN